MHTTSRLVMLTRLAALPLAATLLVACGGGDDASSDSASGSASADASESSASEADSAYCQDLESASDTFAGFGGTQTTPDQIQQGLDTFKSLAAEAPSEVEAPWQTIDGAIDKLETTLDDAGLELGDLAQLQQGTIPKGVTPQELQQVATELQSLGGQEFAAAGDEIEKHAKSACGLDLSPEPSASPSS